MRRSYTTNSLLLVSFFIAQSVFADVNVIGVNTCDTGPCGPPPPLTTSAVGNIRILSTGQISHPGGVDLISINDANRMVVIDPNNTNVGGIALQALAGAGIGIEVTAAGNNANIVVGENSEIRIAEDPIRISAPTMLTNAGRLIVPTGGTGIPVRVVPSGTNTTIVNQISGQILGTDLPGISQNATGFSLFNSGIISMTNVAPAPNAIGLQLAEDFTIVQNEVTGSIIGTTGNRAVDIVGNLSGDIQNFGTITSPFEAIQIRANYNGDITNHIGGVIEGTAGGGVPLAIVINSSGDFNNINNAGLIVGDAEAIRLSIAPTSGVINNLPTGVIRSNTNAAISFLGSIDTLQEINNQGLIETSSPGQAAISKSGAVGGGIPGGIINSGDIINLVGPDAINLESVGVFSPIIQNAGTITGNILLPLNVGGNAFTINGGTINGDITAGNSGGNTLSLDGGTINGTVTLGNGGDTLNLSATTVDFVTGGTGNDTYTISGGRITGDLTDAAGTVNLTMSGGMIDGNINLTGSAFEMLTLTGGDVLGNIVMGGVAASNVVNLSGTNFSLLDGSAGPSDTLNVDGTYTLTGMVLNFTDLNILNAGTELTVSNTIMGLNGDLTVNPNTSLIFATTQGSLGTGNITNDGVLRLNDGVAVNHSPGDMVNNGIFALSPGSVFMGGDFDQNAGADFEVGISSATNFGMAIFSGTPTLNAGSVTPILGNTFIPENSDFPIIMATNAVVDNSTLNQPASSVVFFTKAANVGGNNLILTLHRVPYESVAQSVVSKAVAQTLYPLMLQAPNINSDILAVITELDFLTDAQTLTKALESLAPSFNYALVRSSNFAFSSAFEGIQLRLEDLHRPVELQHASFSSGHNTGDTLESHFKRDYGRSWARATGLHINQRGYEDVNGYSIEGYHLDGSGVALGSDWKVLSCADVGLAFSYLKESATDKTFARNTVETRSYQGTVYGWYQPLSQVYIDAMMGFAIHEYDTTRHIGIGSFASSPEGSFSGLQGGAQVDIGFALEKGSVYIAPFIRGRLTHLHLDEYSESNTAGIGLQVNNDSLGEQIAGIGLRLETVTSTSNATIVPALWLMALYDFKGEAQTMTSTFLGGGLPFVINSISPQQTIFQGSASVNAYLPHRVCLSAKYNIEYRTQMVANSAYVMFGASWG